MVLYLGAQQVAASLDEIDMSVTAQGRTRPRPTKETWAAMSFT